VAISLRYGRVTLEREEDVKHHEVVVVFRAQDQLLPRLLRRYKNMCVNAGSSQQYLDEIEETFVKVLLWQAGWGTKVPGSE
jgi:hypothetical protein